MILKMYGIDFMQIITGGPKEEKNIIINLSNQTIKCDKKIYKVNEDQIKNIFRIIRNKNKLNSNTDVIDAESIKIYLYKNNMIVDRFLYKKNQFNDYTLLKNMIGELCKNMK